MKDEALPPQAAPTDEADGPEEAVEEPERGHSELRHLASSAASLATSAAGSAASLATSAADAAASLATSAAGSAASLAKAGLDEVGTLASGARRRITGDTEARRRASEPLPLLYDVHPEARRAAPRDLGIRIVPIEHIAGTAVAGSAQRGRDFKPLPQLRGLDWQARWQRILQAMDRLVVLPPVELMKVGDEYWVLDGHNRVAAALEIGQVAVDADVTELQVPGRAAADELPLGDYLGEESRALRNAGSGRRRAERERTTSEPAEPEA